MAIDDELKAQILRYHFVEHWRVGTIASQLGVHHSTVERVLGEAGVERERQRPRRPSKLDSYMAFITETLERFPTLTAARLFDMVKARGYPTQSVSACATSHSTDSPYRTTPYSPNLGSNASSTSKTANANDAPSNGA